MARLFSARTLILGGLAAGAAYALRNNPTVKGLLGGGTSAPEPYNPPGPAPAPAVANVDVAGPPENTATHVPAPDPVIHTPAGGIDEAAEEAAAAAEAANIGGAPEAYPDEEGRPIDEAMRPLEESGEGYAEGQELAEADLIENTEPAAGDPIEAERQIDEVIEAQDDPFSGEVAEGGDAGPPAQPTEPPLATEGVGGPDSGVEPTEQLPLADAPPPSGEPAADLAPPEDAPEAAAVTPATTSLPEESTPAAETPAEAKSTRVWQDTEEQPKVEGDGSA